MKVNDVMGKEAHLKSELKRSVLLSKAIYTEYYSITAIKEALALNDVIYAQQLWDELDLEIQKLLMIAPSKGSPFTTSERAKISSFWKQIGI